MLKVSGFALIYYLQESNELLHYLVWTGIGSHTNESNMYSTGAAWPGY